MKAFEEYRTKRVDEWNNQKKRRLELRCGKYNILLVYIKLSTMKVCMLNTHFSNLCIHSTRKSLILKINNTFNVIRD
jgi:hypothetical protein